MVDFEKVMRGVEHFLDNEILSKMGWQRWVLGTAIELYLKNSKEIYQHLSNEDLIKMLGVIDGDMIDIDAIHREMMKQAQKGSVTIDLPIGMGKVTLTERDVDLLYQHIMNA